MLKIAVLISGTGSNLMSIIESIEKGILNCSLEMVISDRQEALGIEKAKSKGIDTYILDRKLYGSKLSQEILSKVSGKADLIVLAGFLSILDSQFIKHFKNKIINIHPSLIPSFCGPKMYGIRVHESALAYGVKYSGCTVHFVDEGTDTGSIIAQKVVPVLKDDTAESLQKRILEEEHRLLPYVIELIAENRIEVNERKVTIIEDPK